MNTIITKIVLTSFVFHSAFALSSTLRLYVIASFLCIFITLRKSVLKKYLVIIFFLLVLFAYLLTVTFIGFNQQAFNYTLAHFYVFVLTPLACVAVAEGLETKKIIEYHSYLWLFLGLTGFCFWLSLEIFGIDLEALIPGAIERSNKLSAGDRIAIFFGEPTYLGMYMCSLGLLPFLNLSSRSAGDVLKMLTFVFLVWISKSAAFLGACFIASLSTISFVFIQRLMMFRLHKGVLSLGLLLLALILATAFAIGPDLYLKILLLDKNSGNGRAEIWVMALAAIQNTGFFGNGLGAMAVTYGSFLSYMLQILYDGGIVALLLFLMIFLSVYFRVIFSPLDIKSRVILGTSVLAPVIFLATNAAFFYPVYIFTSVFALKILSEAREGKRENLFSE